jgi:hypothetical protein
MHHDLWPAPNEGVMAVVVLLFVTVVVVVIGVAVVLRVLR